MSVRGQHKPRPRRRPKPADFDHPQHFQRWDHCHRILTSLALDYTTLVDNAINTTPPPGTGTRRGTHTPTGLDAISLTDDITRTITSWCRLVADERHLTGPTNPRTTGRIDWLTRHTEWLARHPTGKEFEDEITTLHRRVNLTLWPPTTRTIPIGTCPTCTSDLPGMLWATIGTAHQPGRRTSGTIAIPLGGRYAGLTTDDLHPITCDTDTTHTWNPDDWENLADQLGTTTPTRLTVTEFVTAEAANGRKLHPQRVYSWCHRCPTEVGYDPTTRTLDRVQAVLYWMRLNDRRR